MADAVRVFQTWVWTCDECDEGEAWLMSRGEAEAAKMKHMEEKHDG